MKKTIIALAIMATAISAHAQMFDTVDIPQPPIVETRLGGTGKISFDPNGQSWDLTIDSVDASGGVRIAGFGNVTVLDAITALEKIDPDTDWAEKIPLLYATLFARASDGSYSTNIAEQMTTPVVMPRGIEVPVLVLQSETNAYGIGLIAADDGTVITYIDHQSPRPSAEEIEARKAEKLAEHKARKAAFINGAGNGQLQNRIANLEAYLRGMIGE